MQIKVEYPERRLFDKKSAAEYCHIPPTRFDAICPIPPVKLHESLKPVYDRRDLDRWIDGLKCGTVDLTDDEIVARLD